MARDFYPEGHPGAPPLTVTGRDFVPEGGLSVEEAHIPILDTRRDDHPARTEPPKMAPLLDRDFIHEAIVDAPKEKPGEDTSLGAGIARELNATLRARPREEEAGEAKGSLSLTADKDETLPAIGQRLSAASPETPDFDVPAGYEVSGTDEDGHPIFRRKKQSSPSASDAIAAKDRGPVRSPAVDPARNKGGRPRKVADDAGQKGGEVGEAGEAGVGREALGVREDDPSGLTPHAQRPTPAGAPPPTRGKVGDLPGHTNPFDGIFDKKPKDER